MGLLHKLIRLDKALMLLHKALRPIKDFEELEIRKTLGRILAEDVISSIDIPPFDRAAMDGYAVRAEDTYGAEPENPKVLRVIGVSEIGDPFRGKVSAGEAVYVHTGSRIPEGADAVVPIEYVEAIGDKILVRKMVAPGENISKRGEDVEKGTRILEKGQIISPADIAMMKAIGIRKVRVVRKPKIAVMACGSELVDNIEELSPGKILEYSREIVIGYANKLGAETIDLGIVPDDESEILNRIQQVREKVDLLVTVGGTSVGKHDLIPHIIRKYGELLFHGVSVEPGKPICAGKMDELPILGFPGLPVATFVATFTILIRALERLTGVRGRYAHRTVRAVLRRKIWSKPGVRTYVRVRLIRENNRVYAEPIMISGSGILSSVVMSDGIVVVPEELEGVEEEREVEVIVIRDSISF